MIDARRGNPTPRIHDKTQYLWCGGSGRDGDCVIRRPLRSGNEIMADGLDQRTRKGRDLPSRECEDVKALIMGFSAAARRGQWTWKDKSPQGSRLQRDGVIRLEFLRRIDWGGPTDDHGRDRWQMTSRSVVFPPRLAEEMVDRPPRPQQGDCGTVVGTGRTMMFADAVGTEMTDKRLARHRAVMNGGFGLVVDPRRQCRRYRLGIPFTMTVARTSWRREELVVSRDWRKYI